MALVDSGCGYEVDQYMYKADSEWSLPWGRAQLSEDGKQTWQLGHGQSGGGGTAPIFRYYVHSDVNVTAITVITSQRFCYISTVKPSNVSMSDEMDNVSHYTFTWSNRRITTQHQDFDYKGRHWYLTITTIGLSIDPLSVDVPFYSSTPFIMDERNIGISVLDCMEREGHLSFDPYYAVDFNHTSGRGTIDSGCGVNNRQYIHSNRDIPLTPNTYTKANHFFLGWDTDPAATTVVYEDGEVVRDLAIIGESITLYAVWGKAHTWLVEDADNKNYTAYKGGNVQTRERVYGVTDVASDYYNDGFLFKPDDELFTDLPSPIFKRWDVDEQPITEITAHAVPLIPQPIVFNGKLIRKPIKYINIIGSDDALWCVSTNGGSTWFKHNGTAWVQVSNSNDGCVKRNLERLNATDWASKCSQGDTLIFKCLLRENETMSAIKIIY